MKIKYQRPKRNPGLYGDWTFLRMFVLNKSFYSHCLFFRFLNCNVDIVFESDICLLALTEQCNFMEEYDIRYAESEVLG